MSRLDRYLNAVEKGNTEKYWDLQDAYKQNMTWREFYEKWGNKRI